jgi:hypothetical protein
VADDADRLAAVEEVARRDIIDLRAHYDIARHVAANGDDAAQPLSDESRRVLVDEYAIAGDRAHVARRLAELEREGVSRLYLTGLVEDPRRLIRLLATFRRSVSCPHTPASADDV